MMKRSREEGKNYRRNLPFQSDAMARKIMNKLLCYFMQHWFKRNFFHQSQPATNDTKGNKTEEKPAEAKTTGLEGKCACGILPSYEDAICSNISDRLALE